jgi:hypothetical protein
MLDEGNVLEDNEMTLHGLVSVVSMFNENNDNHNDNHNDSSNDNHNDSSNENRTNGQRELLIVDVGMSLLQRSQGGSCSGDRVECESRERMKKSDREE